MGRKNVHSNFGKYFTTDNPNLFPILAIKLGLPLKHELDNSELIPQEFEVLYNLDSVYYYPRLIISPDIEIWFDPDSSKIDIVCLTEQHLDLVRQLMEKYG